MNIRRVWWRGGLGWAVEPSLPGGKLEGLGKVISVLLDIGNYIGLLAVSPLLWGCWCSLGNYAMRFFHKTYAYYYPQL